MDKIYTEVNKTRKNKTRKDKTRKNKTRKNRTRKNRTRKNKTRKDKGVMQIIQKNTRNADNIVAYAQTMLKLTHDTNRALREGRLGANEWFEFLNSIEMLAKNMQLHEENKNKSHPKIANAIPPYVANNNW